MMRVLRLSLIASLLCATGAQWVLLQTVAWAKMSMDAMGSKGVVAAVVAATDGRHPCALCHAARNGAAETQKRLPARGSSLRLDFASAASAVVSRVPVPLWIVDSIRVAKTDAVASVEPPPPCRLPA
jgi:hypothetical protein